MTGATSLTQAIGTSHPSGARGKPRPVVESQRVGALSPPNAMDAASAFARCGAFLKKKAAN